ncbi:hypothetical protein [Legionella brunensis]|uniref:Uncharacterized protein n=1 Tax=Legionella brunensis TaxID=29422 RepID=A0A0W0S5F6_9GAMM|nr:hypothetical protein [Legionella brunensis]KTC78379.1 hypothetical protein Lbru_2671 [Legionella brunensis]
MRITQILGGKVLSVTDLQLGEKKDDIAYQIKFVLNDIERTFVYAKYEVSFKYAHPFENTPVRTFLISQNPDALLLKAIPDTLLELPDGLAMARAAVTKEEQLVLSDARTYNWQNLSFTMMNHNLFF